MRFQYFPERVFEAGVRQTAFDVAAHMGLLGSKRRIVDIFITGIQTICQEPA